jgi:Fe-S-cluster containining protein
MELSVCNGCDQCGGRCIEGFAVTREEYEAVLAYLAGVPVTEQERVARQPKTLPWPGAEDTGATVTYCRYRDLEKGCCSIYLSRPTICRLFGHTEWLPCPIGAVGHYPEDAANVWNDYRRLERHTFEEWDKISSSEKEIPERAMNE